MIVFCVGFVARCLGHGDRRCLSGLRGYFGGSLEEALIGWVSIRVDILAYGARYFADRRISVFAESCHRLR